MTDMDKVKLIEHVAVDALEYGEMESSDFYRGILQAIASICDYKEVTDG
jgi:hypothetical protein